MFKIGNTKENRKATGWRIDYCLTDEKLDNKISEIKLRDDIFGSDHCPMELLLKLK